MPSTAIARSDTDFQSNLSLEAQLVRNALIEKGLETPMSVDCIFGVNVLCKMYKVLRLACQKLREARC